MMIRLCRHIEILLLSNDCVVIPGFGGFMAHHVDARKDSEDGSFLPPVRSIGFNPKLTLNDSLLAQSYVEAYDISYPEATMRIEDEVRELKQRIETEGRYEFNGIGTISLNADGNYEFEPCEAGILSPSLYGLDRYSIDTIDFIKRHIKSLSTSTAAHVTDSPAVGMDDADETEHSRQDGKRRQARVVAIWRNVAVACIAIILFLLLPSPLSNNTQMAGTSIDTRLLDKVMPKNITTGQDEVNYAIKRSSAIQDVKTEEAATVSEKDDAASSLKDGYSIVVASHVTVKNAQSYVEALKKRGYSDAFIHRGSHVKVLMGKFATRDEAYSVLDTLNDKQEFAGAWISKFTY